MPYISPKMARTEEDVVALSDVLAGTSLDSRLVGTDSSSSVSPLSSNSSRPGMTPATPASVAPDAPISSSEPPSTAASTTISTPSLSIEDRPPPPSAALEEYSRAVYAFTMGLYTDAKVKDLRRNKGQKSYSFTTPKRPTPTEA